MNVEGANSRHPPRVLEHETEHTLRNHVAIIAGYCELLLSEMAQDDPRRNDILEMQHAASAIFAIFSQSTTE